MASLLTNLFVLLSISTNVECESFNISLSGSIKPVWSFWSIGTTTDHAYLALRADFRQQLEQVKTEIGMKYLRFYGIFNNDIGIVNREKPYTKPLSFFNVDSIYDYLLSIDMQPIVELDFVPQPYAVVQTPSASFGNFDVFVGPPNNYTLWYDLIYQFISHLTERYGPDEVSTWYFDMWDEPNVQSKWLNSNETQFKEVYQLTLQVIMYMYNMYINSCFLWQFFTEYATGNK